MTAPHGPIDALLEELHASRGGLTTDEARRRLGEVGPNEPARAPRTAGLVQILLLLANPLVIILLIASVVSALLGERVNASIIVLMVVLSVVLNFVQTYRSQRAAERLRDAVAPTATVLRDGTWSEIRRREVVPGDVVRLAAGDLVPADARLLEARDLHVQQAALTGESMPVEKDAGDLEAAPRQPADARNVVFLGTSVVSGTATALVVATGPATAFGDIAARLSTRPPETEFERGTRQFALLIMRTVFFLVLFVLLAGALLHHAFLESLLFAVALAVGLTPEFLPMITAVTLSRGAAHMARQKVIVKHLAAIQNFGSMDILCSDKTGTLTSGDMALDRHLDPLGQAIGAAACPRLRQQPLRDRHQEPARRGDPQARRRRHQRVPEDRRDPVRLRAPPALRRRRARRRAPADHEGRARGRPRLLHGLRGRRSARPRSTRRRGRAATRRTAS